MLGKRNQVLNTRIIQKFDSRLGIFAMSLNYRCLETKSIDIFNIVKAFEIQSNRKPPSPHLTKTSCHILELSTLPYEPEKFNLRLISTHMPYARVW